MSKVHIVMDEIIEKYKERGADGLKTIDLDAVDHLMDPEVREDGRRDSEKVKHRDEHGKPR